METPTKYGSGSNSNSNLKNDINDVKDSLAKTAQHASERAGDLLNDVKEHTADIQKSVVSYVKSNPGKSVGIAVLAGFVAAIILRK